MNTNRKVKGKNAQKRNKVNVEMELEGNRKLNTIKKKQFKKERKDLKRKEKLVMLLANSLNENNPSESDNYDFTSDFVEL